MDGDDNAEIFFEREDNYQKQTYRNRQYIYGANGKLLLNIPILHPKKGEKKVYKHVEIDPNENWRSLHLKSIESAYQSSPFFEFYYDNIQSTLSASIKSLYEFNVTCTKVVLDSLELFPAINFTNSYKIYLDDQDDFRYLVNAKATLHANFPKYTQVFDDKHGFIPNLSILDLLFNEGPASLRYLYQVGNSL
ncbi:WbqC family protein [Gangjinia marincola]|uniref:WbqC family protein n=2 Tax=Gangjinia marincola TaxID=578463 RepID=A0ABN1MIG7_9FLAO